jgi:hypothetical protein
MSIDRVSPGTSVIDVLDHVLDKGIVIDAWVRVSLVGIDLITVEARVIVASIDTRLPRHRPGAHRAVGLAGNDARAPPYSRRSTASRAGTNRRARRPASPSAALRRSPSGRAARFAGHDDHDL